MTMQVCGQSARFRCTLSASDGQELFRVACSGAQRLAGEIAHGSDGMEGAADAKRNAAEATRRVPIIRSS